MHPPIREPAAGLLSRQLALVVTALALVACQAPLEQLAGDLPACELACAADARDEIALELAPGRQRVWKAGEPTGDDELTTTTKPSLNLLCHRDVPGDRITELVERPALAKLTAVRLAGFDGSKIGFTTFGLWRADDPAQSPLRAEPIGRDALLDTRGTPRSPSAAPCASTTGEVCPIVVMDPREYTCAEMVRAADHFAHVGRVVAFNRGPQTPEPSPR